MAADGFLRFTAFHLNNYFSHNHCFRMFTVESGLLLYDTDLRNSVVG